MQKLYNPCKTTEKQTNKKDNEMKIGKHLCSNNVSGRVLTGSRRHIQRGD